MKLILRGLKPVEGKVNEKAMIRNRYEPPHDKTKKMTVRPAKTQMSLGIHPVWSESSLCAQWVAKDPSFFYEDSEDSDQTGRMPRLIWVFAGRTVTLLVLSWGGSYDPTPNGKGTQTPRNASRIKQHSWKINWRGKLFPSRWPPGYINKTLIEKSRE